MTADPIDALRREVLRLRTAVALLATRIPELTNDDGRILVELLTPPTAELEPRPPAPDVR